MVAFSDAESRIELGELMVMALETSLLMKV